MFQKSIGLIIVPLLASVALMLLINFDNDSRLWSAIQNAGHFLIFSVLAYCYLALLQPRRLHQLLTHVSIVLTLLCLGGFVELAQSFMPDRNASWSDLMLDSAGILMGYLIFLLAHNRRSLSKKSCLGLVVCAFTVAFFSARPALKLSAYHLLKTSSPTVISFSDPFVEAIIGVSGSAAVKLEKTHFPPHFNAKRTLLIDFANRTYSGVVFHETTRNWSEAGYLEFKLHNTNDRSKNIALRINDRVHNNDYHDRFNTQLLVKPGTNAYQFSTKEIKLRQSNEQAKRPLDMDNIHEIQLFSLENNSFSIYLSDLHLTPL